MYGCGCTITNSIKEKYSLKMLINNLTVCIFAFNEEARILRCIKNFSPYTNILVVDNFSTDKTRKVVEDFGVRCVSIKNNNFWETPEVIDPVLSEVHTEYVLIASVSEYVPLNLLKKYIEVANTGEYDVVRAFRVSITAGEPIPISGVARKGFVGDPRFFRKGSLDFSRNMLHSYAKPVCSADKVWSNITNPALHFYQFREYDCSHTETTLCRYDDVLAKQRYEAGQRFSWSRALYYSCKAFLTSYVRFGSLRFGMLGFIHSYYRWHMEFTVWLRIWEWEKSYTRADVIRRNNSVRQHMEAELDADRSANKFRHVPRPSSRIYIDPSEQ
jgi:glycosyltransferase involved in cell wall biosynthesis